MKFKRDITYDRKQSFEAFKENQKMLDERMKKVS
jgi:hypothetical protein